MSEEDWQATPEPVRRGLARVLEELQRLREQLGQTSRNSSRPPSSDPPSVPARKKEATGRTRGGQPGHPGQSRALLPEERVDEIIQVRPGTCRGCGHVFAEAASDPRPRRHQVQELPRVAPRVTEYRIHTLCCPSCGREATAALPAGVPQGMLGPRATALIGACTGQYHLSKRATQAFVGDVCGLQVSGATICAAERTVSAALEAPVAEAREAVRQAPERWTDETGWPQQRDPDPLPSASRGVDLCAQEEEEASDLLALPPAPAESSAGVLAEAEPGAVSPARGRGESRKLPKGWLWVSVCARATVFLIRRSRGGRVAEELLGKQSSAIDHTDRLSAYSGLNAWLRQLCWAHLQRDFTRISERAGVSARIGGDLLVQSQQLFALWHRYRDGPLSWGEFQTQMDPVREAVGALLREGAALATASGGAPPGRTEQRTARTCHNLVKSEISLWTLVRVEGVEPTNNRAEQAIRTAVLYRKVSFGTQGRTGSRYVERVLTAVATCKQHERNVLDYLTAAVTAHYRREAAPSLLRPLTAG